MSIVVLSAGGHASVVIEALRSRGLYPVAAVDRDRLRAGATVDGVPIIGTDDDAAKLSAAETELANGLGNRASSSDSGLANRRAIFERFVALGYRFPVITHMTSVIATSAELREGAQILAGSIVQPNAIVGRNAIVNTGAIVEHDCRVGSHAHIAPGAILCGGVVIGDDVHIGAGAIVLNGLTVGQGAVVAAGAVVSKNVTERGFATMRGQQRAP